MAALAINDLPDGRRVVVLSGRLDATSVPLLWDPAHRALSEVASQPVDVDTAAVDYCDGAGMALLVDLVSHPRPAAVQLVGMQAGVATIYRQFDPTRLEHDLDPEPTARRWSRRSAAATYNVLRDLRRPGRASSASWLPRWVSRSGIPRTVRWRDVWRICERTGADALPIVALLSFLLGMILAFQSAVPMKRFGAEIFVADLLGLAVLRELGPLMTAILLAGRSGAAFAAEIGTMTVNQEVDALTTMGLDPVRFLVTPRIIAAVLMTPLLTLVRQPGRARRWRADDADVFHSPGDIPQGGGLRRQTWRFHGRLREVIRVRAPDRGCRAACAACRPGRRVGGRRQRDAGGGFGHHPARRRRRHLRRSSISCWTSDADRRAHHPRRRPRRRIRRRRPFWSTSLRRARAARCS